MLSSSSRLLLNRYLSTPLSSTSTRLQFQSPFSTLTSKISTTSAIPTTQTNFSSTSTSLTILPSESARRLFLKFPNNAFPVASASFSKLSPTTRYISTTLLFKTPVCYMATKKRPLSPEEKDMRAKKKKNEPQEAQWWRANDGVWADERQQNHHKRVAASHLRAEETYTKKEYNDYIKELASTRDIAVSENRDRKLMDDIDPETEDENPLPFGPSKNKEKMDNLLLKAVNEKDKDMIESKYSTWLDDDTRKKQLWLLLILSVVFYLPFDDRNPDLPG